MAKPAPTILNTRELKATDSLGLVSRAEPVQPEPIARVSNRHHALARCLALGMTAHEASLSTGYCISRISILQKDELFKELCEFYKAQSVDVFKTNAEQLQGLTSEALATIRERLETEPQKISTKELVAIAQLAADRSGHGPQQTNVSVDISLSERMSRARERVQAIEGELVS